MLARYSLFFGDDVVSDALKNPELREHGPKFDHAEEKLADSKLLNTDQIDWHKIHRFKASGS